MRPLFRLPLILFHTRPRLLIGGAIGIAVGWGSDLFMPHLALISRLLLGWNTAVWAYLVLIMIMMVRVTPDRMREKAQIEDESAHLVLTITCLAALASVVAIVVELSGGSRLLDHDKALRYAFTALTIVGSWLLVGMSFTLHYARMFYTSRKQRPLKFPEDGLEPDYWDFLYFSFTIAVAAQTADVAVITRSMRKTVLSQQLLAFLFNSAILGLSINVAASLLS